MLGIEGGVAGRDLESWPVGGLSGGGSTEGRSLARRACSSGSSGDEGRRSMVTRSTAIARAAAARSIGSCSSASSSIIERYWPHLPLARLGLKSLFERLEFALLDLRYGGDFLTANVRARDTLDDFELTHLTRIDEGDGLTRSTRPGAANAVHVVFRIWGNVEVHDVAYFRNIQTAGCHVRGYEDLDAARAEGTQHLSRVA